jgi:hypothetical protein
MNRFAYAAVRPAMEPLVRDAVNNLAQHLESPEDIR